MSREMRLAFVVDGFDPQGSIGKVLLSFVRELRRAYHVQPVIIAAEAGRESQEALPPGIELVVGRYVKRRVCDVGWKILMDYYTGVVGRKLARLVSRTPADCYLHFSTCGWAVTKAKRSAPMGYLSNGLVYAAFYSEPWYRNLDIPPAIKLPIRLTAPLISSWMYKLGQGFDFYLANSHYSQEYLFLHLGYHAKTVHLPVELGVYSPGPTTQRGGYLLSVGTSSEIEFNTIERLARDNRVVRVGRDSIPNCDNRGYVSTQELADLYRSATATLYPHYQEPFGLVPVESMSSGTPVVTYACQGPGETVQNGVTGWTVDTQAEFLARAVQVLRAGVSAELRQRCREYALERFSPQACTRRLVEAVQAVCSIERRA